MSGASIASYGTWLIAGLATAGVVIRPFRWPEYLWAVLGALLLCILGLLQWSAALAAVGRGTDVYLFLIGMMVVSELARQEGLFDHLAARTAKQAKGSSSRLFALIFGVGTVVTVLMSNDATAVVLTPAVLAATRAAKVSKPLPYLYICAFVANAASFVLPISNPANLVIFQDKMPPLLDWFVRFSLPSLLAIGMTFAMLRWCERDALREPLALEIDVPPLSGVGKVTGWGVAAMALVMLIASAVDVPLGLPTFLSSVAVYIVVCLSKRRLDLAPLRGLSWGVIPLVAGLFVLVQGLQQTGVIDALAHLLDHASHDAEHATVWGAGIAVALASNVLNNLPTGLIAGSALGMSHVPVHVNSAVLIGVDLGPNLSVTGSLATILWLTALRREDVHVSTGAFLAKGVFVMLPALIAALAALSIVNRFQ